VENQGNRASKNIEQLINPKKVKNLLRKRTKKEKFSEVIIAAEKELSMKEITRNGKTKKRYFLTLSLDYVPPEIDTNLYRWKFKISKEMYEELSSIHQKDDYAEIIIKL